MPNGVALRNGSLYVAEVNRILKFDNIEQQLDNASYTVVRDDFPTETLHGWKFIRFGPDGKLYVPIGAPCNVCLEEEYARIMRMNPDGKELEVFALGVRNTMGFDWHPETHELWFTDNGRDWLGDDLPPDELNHAPEQGLHFGFPYCHGGTIQDPEFTSRRCDEFVEPALQLGPHVAALGMRFYTGDMFPEYYRNGIFIAEHGSWNRKTPIGYRVMFVKLENNVPVSYEVFAEGWLQGTLSRGRPVDIEIMNDGSILISDDKAGKIYRVGYEK
jgi:glucose/arabinose dehydrogenase